MRTVGPGGAAAICRRGGECGAGAGPGSGAGAAAGRAGDGEIGEHRAHRQHADGHADERQDRDRLAGVQHRRRAEREVPPARGDHRSRWRGPAECFGEGRAAADGGERDRARRGRQCCVSQRGTITLPGGASGAVAVSGTLDAHSSAGAGGSWRRVRSAAGRSRCAAARAAGWAGLSKRRGHHLDTSMSPARRCGQPAPDLLRHVRGSGPHDLEPQGYGR